MLQTAVRGVLINILNPKRSIFFLAFLPPCVPSGAGSPIGQRVVLSAVFMGTALIIFILYGVLAMSTRLPQCPQVA
jgi:threonine/homoserine/homoserine lactone efflux protein